MAQYNIKNDNGIKLENGSFQLNLDDISGIFELGNSTVNISNNFDALVLNAANDSHWNVGDGVLEYNTDGNISVVNTVTSNGYSLNNTLFQISFSDGASGNVGYLDFRPDTLSSNQTWTFPDATGTLALTSDIDQVKLDIGQATYDMTGFVNRTDSTISFDDVTRTFEISPTLTSYTVWYRGEEIEISSTLNIVINNTNGGRYIAIDPVTMTLQDVGPIPSILEDLLVAYIYWDAVNGESIIFGDERHASHTDTQWHLSQHLDVGAVWRSGGTLSYTLDNDTAVTLGITNIQIADEDLVHNISHSATPSNFYEQILSPTAEIPVLYLDGTSLVQTTPSTQPWIPGTSRASYNLVTGGSGSLADGGNGDYITYWLLATNDTEYPVKLLLGRDSYSDIADAEAEQFDGADLSFPEMVPMYRIVVQTSSTYSGNPASIVISSVAQIITRQSGVNFYNTITSGVIGAGTVNYIPKWTPNGNTLGNSIITDDGATITIGGNLTVQGTTTTIDSTVATYVDPIISLNTLTGGGDPISDNAKDIGINGKWFDSAAKDAFFGFDRSSQRFTFIPDATITSEIVSGTLGDVEFNKAYLSQIQISTSPSNGYFLKSDASGNGSWAQITAADVSGSIGGSGTNNYVAKWTPDGTTLGNSLIQDDGAAIELTGSYSNNGRGLFTLKNEVYNPVNNNFLIGLKLDNRYLGTPATNISITGLDIVTGNVLGGYSNIGIRNGVNGTLGVGGSHIIGILNLAGSNITNNEQIFGIYNQIGPPAGNTNTSQDAIGIFTNVMPNIGGGNAYLGQFKDGTEGVGKFLKSVTFDGKANWAQITKADITSGIDGGGTNNYISKWTPDGTTLGDSLIQDDGTSVYNRGAGDISSNTAFGEDALITNTTGQNNTALGKNSLKNNTAGQNNTALGASTLIFNTTGFSNTAIGGTTLVNNTNGYNNTAVGYAAISTNTTGINNSAVGYAALSGNATGNGNVAFGNNALLQNSAGQYSTVIGSASLLSHTNGNYNNTLGAFTLEKLLTGSSNIALGYQAGRSVASGADLTISNNSIFIGGGTRANIDNTSNEIVIGSGSIGLGQNTTVIGNSSTVLTRLEGQLQLDNVPAGTLVNNLGIDASGNVIIGSSGTPFYLLNTTTDAGNDKTSAIERTGSISLKLGAGIMMDREDDGFTELATFGTNYISIMGSEDSSGSDALIAQSTYTPYNVYSTLRHTTVHGTKATPLATVIGKTLNAIAVRTFDGSTYFDVSSDSVKSTENMTSSAHGVERIFKKKNNGSTVLSEIMRFTGDGSVKLNNAYEMPNIDGTSGQVMKTDGAGSVSFGSLYEADILDLGTYAKVGTYTDTRIPRWNSTTNTLESGSIRDNGLGNVAVNSFINTNHIFRVEGNSTNTTTYSRNTYNNPSSSNFCVFADASGTTNSHNYGVFGISYNATGNNIGVAGSTNGISPSEPNLKDIGVIGGLGTITGATLPSAGLVSSISQPNNQDSYGIYINVSNPGTGNAYIGVLKDGSEGAGKVLTSDANGVATWQTPTGGSGGGLTPTYQSGTTYTASGGDLVVAANAALVITLPTAASGLIIGVKAVVAPTGIEVRSAAAAETIDGQDRSTTGESINNQWDYIEFVTYSPDGGTTWDWLIR